ncbi:hypothetical protein AB0C93_29650 [Streptomyces sp. NPDC048518]|uniref:hypothetical protein n=1 Tax=Streptomyces sp. NPDC048518 TaxID=3155029 RepID=UPI0034107B31
MRALPVRRIATTALCAGLLIGAAGPALAAHGDASRDETRAARSAPAPDPKALLGQAQQLGALGGVLTPVTDLLTTALKAKDGKLPPQDVKKHADAVKKALAAAAKPPAKAAGDPAAALPQTPAALPQTPAAPQLPAMGAQHDARALMDPKADAVAALQKAVDGLLKAATAGDPKALLAAVPPVLTGLVNTVAATLQGGGLPAPNLPGLPKSAAPEAEPQGAAPPQAPAL